MIVGDALSSAEIVLNGVPQGSCLGPVLFCLFINDLPLVVHHSTIKMFADDVKLYCSLTNSDEASLLQKDLDAVHNWCNANSMFVNENKCRVVHYFGKVEQSYQYHLAGHSILPVENFRDLGVHFDSSLRFDKHVSEVTRKANYQLLCLRRNFRKFNLHSFIAIYKSTVRPILEYNSSVWYPLNKNDRARVEKIQQRATKLVPYLKHLPYENRLHRLGLSSLQFRRDRADIINTFRIIKGIDNINTSQFFTFNDTNRTRYHPHKLYPSLSKRKIGQHSFYSRVWKPWNDIPPKTFLTDDINKFKTRLAETNFQSKSFLNNL